MRRCVKVGVCEGVEEMWGGLRTSPKYCSNSWALRRKVLGCACSPKPTRITLTDRGTAGGGEGGVQVREGQGQRSSGKVGKWQPKLSPREGGEDLGMLEWQHA